MKPTKWLCAQRRICLGWSESSLCTQPVAMNPSFLHADSEDSDQTGQMPRLIWVFAGHTCYFVGFVMRRLNYHKCNEVVWQLSHCFNFLFFRSDLFGSSVIKNGKTWSYYLSVVCLIIWREGTKMEFRYPEYDSWWYQVPVRWWEEYFRKNYDIIWRFDWYQESHNWSSIRSCICRDEGKKKDMVFISYGQKWVLWNSESLLESSAFQQERW